MIAGQKASSQACRHVLSCPAQEWLHAEVCSLSLSDDEILIWIFSNFTNPTMSRRLAGLTSASLPSPPAPTLHLARSFRTLPASSSVGSGSAALRWLASSSSRGRGTVIAGRAWRGSAQPGFNAPIHCRLVHSGTRPHTTTVASAFVAHLCPAQSPRGDRGQGQPNGHSGQGHDPTRRAQHPGTGPSQPPSLTQPLSSEDNNNKDDCPLGLAVGVTRSVVSLSLSLFSLRNCATKWTGSSAPSTR